MNISDLTFMISINPVCLYWQKLLTKSKKMKNLHYFALFACFTINQYSAYYFRKSYKVWKRAESDQLVSGMGSKTATLRWKVSSYE